MRRTLAWLAALAMLLTASGLAEAGGNYIGNMIVVNCDEWVSLRESPSAKAARLKKVPLYATLEECVQYDDEFVYGCYDGAWGYVLDRYLIADGEGVAGDGAGDETDEETATRRQREILVEGEPEIIEERRHESRLGFSIWYDEEAFVVLDGLSETGAPSFLMEGMIDLPDAVVYMEFLSPEITGLKGDNFLNRMPKQYGVKHLERRRDSTDAGASVRCVSGVLENRELRFYTVVEDQREVQIVVTLSEEIMEGWYPRIESVIRSIEFT